MLSPKRKDKHKESSLKLLGKLLMRLPKSPGRNSAPARRSPTEARRTGTPNKKPNTRTLRREPRKLVKNMLTPSQRTKRRHTNKKTSAPRSSTKNPAAERFNDY